MGLQLRELLTRYGDVFVVWFDGLDNQRKYDGYRVHQMIHELQPMTLINDRIGLRGDFVTPEQRLPKGIPRKNSKLENINPNDEGVLVAPPRPEEFQPWETSMTINDTWAYNKNDRKFKSTTDLVHALIDAASKGGNFLLNIGPMPDGTVQPEFQERLRGIGAWLKVNGEAIYGTTFGPLQDVPFGRTTAKGNTVYLHVYSLPANTLQVAGLGPVKSVRALNGGQILKFTQEEGRLSIQTAGVRPDEYATVFVVER
jgi:alpha-L-fucosidase